MRSVGSGSSTIPTGGTTTLDPHDAFGELISSTDALGRVVTFDYDALGRTRSRVDLARGAEMLTTTWTWDTAAHGIGKLTGVASPDGEKTYTYTGLGQLETLALAVGAGDGLPDRQARLRQPGPRQEDHLSHAPGRGGVRGGPGLRPLRPRARRARRRDEQAILEAHRRRRRRALQVRGIRQRRLHGAGLLPRQAEPPEHRHRARHDGGAGPGVRLRRSPRPREPLRRAPGRSTRPSASATTR